MCIRDRLKDVEGQAKRLIPFEDYQDFLRHLQTVFRDAEPKVQEAVIKTLIHKIEVNRESAKIHYIVDKDHIKKGGPVGSPSFLGFFEKKCSNTLTNGGLIEPL